MVALTAASPTSAPAGPSTSGLGRLTISATKHHGLGNDFLIALEPPRSLSSNDAIAWCDRRRGIGADGLIMAERLADDLWAMTLWNSDGSRPEVSGNGLRCLGQALARHVGATDTHTFTVRTDGGLRTLRVEPDRRSDSMQVQVDMGPATTGPPLSERWLDAGVDVIDQLGVDVGNPHLVALVDDVSVHDPREFGPLIEADYPDGINVHLIDVVDRHAIRLVVWERGAGYTEACGSGACAAAWAARQWGLVDDSVRVSMPGGSATVAIVESPAPAAAPSTAPDTATASNTVLLTGPAVYVGTVLLDG